MGVKKLKQNQKGFTLIELLVVIAIIGLLASVVLLALNSARSKSRDAKRVADIRQMASGLELYYNDCNSYPQLAATKLLATMKLFSGNAATCGANTGTGGAAGSENGGIGTTATGTTYIGQMPVAPTPADDGSLATNSKCSEANGTVGVWNDYIYTSSSASAYTLTFCVGAQTGGLVAGRHTASQTGVQ